MWGVGAPEVAVRWTALWPLGGIASTRRTYEQFPRHTAVSGSGSPLPRLGPSRVVLSMRRSLLHFQPFPPVFFVPNQP